MIRGNSDLYELADEAIKECKPDFKKASKEFEKRLDEILKSGRCILNVDYGLDMVLVSKQFLLRGAEGEYVNCDNYYRLSGSLVNDYFSRHLGKYHGDINPHFQHMRLVTAKRMGEKRFKRALAQYIRRRIKDEIKNLKSIERRLNF